MKFKQASKTILTNFDKFVRYLYKNKAECNFYKNLRKIQEKFEGNLKNCEKNFQEVFVINKIRPGFK